MVPIASVVPSAVAELLRQSPLSPGKVAFAWRTAVGTVLDRVSDVRLERGVLLVDVRTSQWAREIQRSSPVILQRLQTLLGPSVVSRLEVRGEQGSR